MPLTESELNELRQLGKLSPEELAACVRPVLLKASPEQQAIVRAASWANQLMKTDDVRQAVATMICARQMYAVAYTEVKRLLDALGEKNELPVMLEDTLVQAAMYEASRPFSEHTFMRGLTETGLPTLAEIIDRHSELDEAAVKAAQEEEEVERKQRPIPIGVRVDVQDEADVLPRDKSLTFVGDSRACRLVAEKLVNSALVSREGQQFTVLWLMDRGDKFDDQSARLIRIRKSEWLGCANTKKDVLRFVGNTVLPRLTGPIDLVVCADLAAAFTSGYRGRPPAASAGDAHHKLFQWCKEAGAALLAFLPMIVNGDPDLSDPALEQLRTFSRVRALRLRGDEEETCIHVGNGTHVFTTTAEQLDGYGLVRT